MEHWSSYWRTQAGTPFINAEYAPCLEILATHWQSIFQNLAAGAAVLDLGTGNGFVAILMAEHSISRHLGWRIKAVDSAEIHPPQALDGNGQFQGALQSINFLSHTCIEKLPFPDRSFDLVCSQFAIEYVDLPRGLSESLRVLKKGGRIGIIAHTRNSALVRGSKVTIQLLNVVLAVDGIVDCARDLIHATHDKLQTLGVEAVQDDPRANAVREAYNRKIRQLQESVTTKAAARLLNDVMDDLTDVIKACTHLTLKQLDQALATVDKKYIAARKRSRDQLCAARDGEKIVDLLKGKGILPEQIRVLSISCNNDPIGSLIEVRKH